MLLSANQNDPALESTVQTLAEKVLTEGPKYFETETKAMETAKSHIHLVKELFDSLKK
jgi:hypothetical protein